jgi:glutaminyl-peptide cyclotransferase
LPFAGNSTSRRIIGLLVMQLLTSAAFAAAPFDADHAFYYLEAQCAMGPRNPGSTGHAQCLAFLKRELSFWADTVYEQPFEYTSADTHERLDLTNIIARFSPQRKDRVLLCAHWDTRPFADQDRNPENQNTPILGADDGASGVAVLLEIARQLAMKPVNVGVDIVLFDGEDYGRESVIADYLLGSKHFAKNLPDPPPKFGVLLDMIGQRDLNIPKEAYSVRMAKPIVDKIWAAAAREKATAFVSKDGNPVIDDHLPLMNEGVPTVDLIDFDYPYWHTLDDTPAHCSANSLGQVGRTLMDLLEHEQVQP